MFDDGKFKNYWIDYNLFFFTSRATLSSSEIWYFRGENETAKIERKKIRGWKFSHSIILLTTALLNSISMLFSY